VPSLELRYAANKDGVDSALGSCSSKLPTARHDFFTDFCSKQFSVKAKGAAETPQRKWQSMTLNAIQGLAIRRLVPCSEVCTTVR